MKRTMAVLLALLALVPAFGAVDGAQLYAKLKSAYKGLSSFQADLKQSNHYPQLKKTISYSGKIYFTPGRMLMSFSQPGVQRLLIENGRVDLYDAQSATVFRAKMLPEFGRMNPLEILQLYWEKSQVTVTQAAGATAKVRLVPKNDQLISSLNATLNPKTGIVSALSYADKNGNTVSYAFSNIKTNAGIPTSVWTYKYPKGVQVVEQ